MKANEDTLTWSQRGAGLATLAAMLLLLGFFASHQWAGTGFFTGRFGSTEMLCLYGPILVSFAAPLVKALGGRYNPARPFEAATNLCLAAGSLWLAIVFPFDFAHLGEVLPGAIRFLFSWITDDIGRAVLVLQVLIGLVMAPATIFTFFSARRRLSAQ